MDELVAGWSKTKQDGGGEPREASQSVEVENKNSTEAHSVENMSCLDAEVMSYVQQLLLEADGQHSVVVVKQGDSSEQTFQFELLSNQEVSSDGVEDTLVVVPSCVSTALKHTSAGAVKISKSGEDSVSTGGKCVRSFYTVKPFSNQSTSKDDISPHTTSQTKEESPGHPNLSSNLSLSSQSYLPTGASSQKPSIATSSHFHGLPANQPSQAAENLLDIAHKLISSKKQNNSTSQPLSKPSHHSTNPVNEGDKINSESVITMYLSSPSELKDKLEILKDNSPVVVVQATSDVDRRSVREAAENAQQPISSPKEPVDPTSTSTAATPERVVELEGTSQLTGEECLYRCQECGYSSHNKHYYKQHVDLVHNEERPYKCPHCDYAGKRRHALLEHMVVHSNNRPFTCGHCNASFRKKGHLTNHIKLHTSQKLVHCGVCNIQLPDSEAFESHLRKIHNTDKLYKCKLCEHTVVDRETMIKHFQTHAESVSLACPVCECQVEGEANLKEHMMVSHRWSHVVNSSVKKFDGSVSSSPGEENLKSSLKKIMCAECGFVSPNEEAMQKHLWSHIRNGTVMSTGSHLKAGTVASRGEVVRLSEASKANGMGVLKKNIDLGQKSLPKDVFYQCTSCAYTSSDNSAFIKHMLAHKTQEKHVREKNAEIPKVKNQVGSVHQSAWGSGVNQNFSSPPLMPLPYTEVMLGKSGQPPARSENNIPFIYDKASARFRCLICNYHCEFQRTIKAHIWKHSGHQNIEYPVFDQSGNAMLGLTNVSTEAKNQPKSSQALEVDGHNSNSKDKSRLGSLTSNQQSLQASQKPSPDKVQLLPVKVSAVRSTSGEHTLSKEKDTLAETPAAVPVPPKQDKHLRGITESQRTSRESKSVVEKKLVQTRSSAAEDCPLQLECNDDGLTCVSNLKVNSSQASTCEVCPEPSVVVEAVDTMPSGYSLTGLKSQQGSPRVSDLESSGGDSKFVTQVRTAVFSSADSDTSASDAEQGLKTTENMAIGDQQWLRCPFCVCQVTDDFKSHFLNCQAKGSLTTKKLESDLKPSGYGLLSGDSREQEAQDNLLLDDTDSTESSDETAAGEGPSGKKSGICSSLLAVIEQLRERSRSESEEDRQGQNSKKSGKKKGRQVDLGVDSIDDLKNIEKIHNKDGDKFRCVLCHYTSERIYNIKIHMKTHRQKKPSECSLCDFSSSSPEALQEHMLKHCKVRTYSCKYCPQNFNHKSTLRAHMRAHKDQEPFLCAYCVFETTNAQEYREHMQVHSGCSSRLRCPGCDLLLAGKDELTAHLLGCKGKIVGSNHHRLISDANLKVKEKLSINLASEVKKEVESVGETSESDNSAAPQLSCVVQGCAFSSSSLKDLQDHLGVHCNTSLLMCNLCDFKAWHSRSLKSHMKRHANDQRYVQQPLEQYKCNLCGYVCHHLPSLKSHMWRHASDQSYSYEFTNDVINAAIDHDNRVDARGEADDPELLDQVINSERKILEGELTKCKRGDGQRPICWVTFRCCSCGFETINKAKLNIHMRTHSDLIQQAQTLDIVSRRKRVGLDDKSQTLAASLPKFLKTENL